MFTDGHAVVGFTTQYGKNDVDDIDKLLDWNAVKAKFWKSETDLDMKRKKEAECLVRKDIVAAAIVGIVVYNTHAKNRLLQFGVTNEKIKILPSYYF